MEFQADLDVGSLTFSRLLHSNEEMNPTLRGRYSATRAVKKEKVASLKNELKRIAEELSITQEELELYNAVLSPFRRLPADVLIEIFKACLRSPEPSFARDSALFSLASVSTLWRGLLLITPSIWSYIFLSLECSKSGWFQKDYMQSLLQKISRWCKRACDLPLEVTFRVTDFHPSQAQHTNLFFKSIIGKLLIPHAHRIVGLHLEVYDIPRFYRSVMAATPWKSLKRLSIRPVTDREERANYPNINVIEASGIFNPFPELRSLQISSAAMDAHVPHLKLDLITHLKFYSICGRHFRILLLHCPNLIVGDFGLLYPEYPTERDDVLTSKNLVSLSLNFHYGGIFLHLLKDIDFPGLRHFSLSSMSYENCNSHNTSSFWKNLSNVTHLELLGGQEMTAKRLRTFLKYAPKISKLELKIGCAACDEILRSIAPHTQQPTAFPETKGSQLWQRSEHRVPDLESLTIHMHANSLRRFRTEQLHDFLVARDTRGLGVADSLSRPCKSLREMILITSGGASHEISSFEDCVGMLQREGYPVRVVKQ